MDLILTILLYVLFLSAVIRHIIRTITFIVELKTKRKEMKSKH